MVLFSICLVNSVFLLLLCVCVFKFRVTAMFMWVHRAQNNSWQSAVSIQIPPTADQYLLWSAVTALHVK